MRKALIITLLAACVMSLGGCGEKDKGNTPTGTTAANQPSPITTTTSITSVADNLTDMLDEGISGIEQGVNDGIDDVERALDSGNRH